MKKRVHIKVYGRVQGVFYRVHTQEQASRLDINGWVMNMPDRTVEIDAEGSKEALEQLIAWANQGPPHARVDNIDIHWEDKLENYTSFTIKRSGWY
ncbi:MAG: acylphosphatase [Candidatus Odinarchaeota archaeon]